MNVFPAGSIPRLQHISSYFPQVQQVSVLRLDELHPIISGNKWYKLRYYLEDAIAKKARSIVTMGGPWSNHIVATAAVCSQLKIPSVGLIRGEEPMHFSTTLQQAKSFNMELVFLSRNEYDQEIIPDIYKNDINYFIPAGGFGEQGAKGASSILETVTNDYNFVLCAVGTGTMLAGLINSSCREQQLIGISALKGHPELEEQVRQLIIEDKNNWSISRDFHFGGYARQTPQLLNFMNEWYKKTGIPSDFVYTGKLFYGVHSLLENGFFSSDARILIVHSGGLQGNASLPGSVLAF